MLPPVERALNPIRGGWLPVGYIVGSFFYPLSLDRRERIEGRETDIGKRHRFVDLVSSLLVASPCYLVGSSFPHLFMQAWFLPLSIDRREREDREISVNLVSFLFFFFSLSRTTNKPQPSP